MKLSTFEQRVDWLIEHPDLWYDWFIQMDTTGVSYYLNSVLNLNFERTGNINLRKRNLIFAMRDAGLFSPRTYWKDIQLRHELHKACELVQIKR